MSTATRKAATKLKSLNSKIKRNLKQKKKKTVKSPLFSTSAELKKKKEENVCLPPIFVCFLFSWSNRRISIGFNYVLHT